MINKLHRSDSTMFGQHFKRFHFVTQLSCNWIPSVERLYVQLKLFHVEVNQNETKTQYFSMKVVRKNRPTQTGAVSKDELPNPSEPLPSWNSKFCGPCGYNQDHRDPSR